MNRPAPPPRTAAVTGATVAAGHLLTLTAAPPLRAVVAAVAADRSPSAVQAVAAGCAGALVGCYAVWVLGLVLSLADAALPCVRGGLAARVPCPRLARRLAATALAGSALGVSLAVGPTATADPHDARRVPPAGARPTGALVGLPLPDRTPTPGRGSAGPMARVAGPPGSTHVVVPGDSLWRVAEATLPAGAPVSVVDRGWRRIAAANRAAVDDPDLILPGTVLRVPPLDDLLGKDRP